MDVSDVLFIFFLVGGGEGGVREARKGGRFFCFENPRKGGGVFRRAERGEAGRLSAGNRGGIFFLQGRNSQQEPFRFISGEVFFWTEGSSLLFVTKDRPQNCGGGKVQRKKIHPPKCCLNNLRGIPDSCHREEGKSSRELYAKARVNAVFFLFFGVSGRFLGL